MSFFPKGGAPRASSTDFTGKVWGLAGQLVTQGRAGTTSASVLTQNFFNKCDNFNTNPSSLAGLTKSGDAAATLTIVDDSTELALLQLTGNAFKLDNSLGSANATVSVGWSGNNSTHTWIVNIRGGSSVIRMLGPSGAVSSVFGATTSYVRRVLTGSPGTSPGAGGIIAPPGQVIYFIRNGLYEGATVPANDVAVNGAAAFDLGSSSMRGLAGTSSAGATIVAPTGAMTVTGKTATVQTGVSFQGLGNAFFPTGAYPTASSGPAPGSVNVGGLVGQLIATGNLGTVVATATVTSPLGSLVISGGLGTVSANAIILAGKGGVLISGLSGTDTASAIIAAPKGSVVITPRLGTVTAGSTATGFKGSVVITGNQGVTIANDVIAEGPPRQVFITGKLGTVIANNNVAQGAPGRVQVTGKLGTVYIANRRRRGHLLTALKG